MVYQLLEVIDTQHLALVYKFPLKERSLEVDVLDGPAIGRVRMHLVWWKLDYLSAESAHPILGCHTLFCKREGLRSLTLCHKLPNGCSLLRTTHWLIPYLLEGQHLSQTSFQPPQSWRFFGLVAGSVVSSAGAKADPCSRLLSTSASSSFSCHSVAIFGESWSEQSMIAKGADPSATRKRLSDKQPKRLPRVFSRTSWTRQVTKSECIIVLGMVGLSWGA